MLITLFFSTLAMAGDCSIPIPQSMFDTKLNDVEEALRNRDSTLMTQKMDQLTDSIPCLAQPVTQIQASRYHTLQGISQFLNKDIDKAQLYFSSARAANSQAIISTDFYPENHMIHKLFSDAPETNEGESLEAPAKGSLLFDGLNSPTRPSYRPTIYQHIQNGKSVSSALLEPLQEIPDYVTESEAQQAEQAKQPEQVPQETVVADTPSEETQQTEATPNTDVKKNSKRRLIGGTLMVLGGIPSGYFFYKQIELQTASTVEDIEKIVGSTDSDALKNYRNQLYITNGVSGLVGMIGLYLFLTPDK